MRRPRRYTLCEVAMDETADKIHSLRLSDCFQLLLFSNKSAAVSVTQPLIVFRNGVLTAAFSVTAFAKRLGRGLGMYI
jgi:hypothetical protein